MAVKLESAARSPVLRLLFKTLIVGAPVYLFRIDNLGFIALLLFVLLFWAIYLRPALNNRKFAVSAVLLFALPLLLPPTSLGLEWILLVLWALALFLLVGVKNLILLRREGSYQTVHLLIVFSFAVLYLLELLPFVPQIILFLLFFLLFREFYFVLAPPYPQRLVLTAATLALILVEITWILSFLTINFLAGAAFLALIVYLFHDLLLHHFQGALSRQIVLRNTTLFIILSLILALLPA